MTGVQPAPGELTSRVCRGCPLLCDDVEIGRTVAGELAFSANVCGHGIRFVREAADHQLTGGCRLNGKPVDAKSAIDTLVSWLQDPGGQRLFAGLEHLTTAGQQQLVRVAGAVGSWIGAPLSGVGPAEISMTRHGRSTASLGEFRNQPGLAVLFAEHGAFVPPRLFERFVHPESSRWALGTWEPNQTIAAGAQASAWSRIGASREELLASLRWLRAVASGVKVPWAKGEAPARWTKLFEQVESSPAVVVFLAGCQGEVSSAPDPLVDGLHQWIQALNRHKPAALVPLDATANSASATGVLAWTWGSAGGGTIVDGKLAGAAHCESATVRIGEGSYNLLFWIDGADREPARDVLESLRQRGDRKLVVLASRNSQVAELADLLLPVAEPGWDDGGDFWRLDELPLRLDRLATSQRPSAATVLRDIADRLASAKKKFFHPPPSMVPVVREPLGGEGPGAAEKKQKKGER